MRALTIISLATILSIIAGSVNALPAGAQQNKDSATMSTSPSDAPEDETFSHFEKVTTGIKPPKATHAPDPKFPDLPAYADERGLVVMLVGVNTKGRVEAVHVLRSTNQIFESSAVDTVKKWKFKPGEKNGKPVPVQVTVEMKFEK